MGSIIPKGSNAKAATEAAFKNPVSLIVIEPIMIENQQDIEFWKNAYTENPLCKRVLILPG